MLILLPPSEGKARARRGAPMRPEGLSFPALTGVREEVLSALIEVSARRDAVAVLGVSPGLADEVAANVHLRATPAKPAREVYTGVLYAALDQATLSPGGRRRAARRLVVISGLYGAVRPGDRIAAYRLAMGVSLPGVGPLARVWRPHLAPVLRDAAGSGLIVDCRSSPYAAAWTPPADLASRWVTVTVPGATHNAKHTRGLLARILCETEADPRRPAGLLDLVSDRFATQLTPPTRPGGPNALAIAAR